MVSGADGGVPVSLLEYLRLLDRRLAVVLEESLRARVLVCVCVMRERANRRRWRGRCLRGVL